MCVILRVQIYRCASEVPKNTVVQAAEITMLGSTYSPVDIVS